MEVNLTDLPQGKGKDEQAGLYFAINDEHYLKLIWYSPNNGQGKVQTLYEVCCFYPAPSFVEISILLYHLTLLNHVYMYLGSKRDGSDDQQPDPSLPSTGAEPPPVHQPQLQPRQDLLLSQYAFGLVIVVFSKQSLFHTSTSPLAGELLSW